MPIKLLSSGGGSVIVNATSTGSNFTVNVPAVNGNIVTTADTGTITQAMLGSGVGAGYGPSFSVYQSSAQTINNGAWTKINLQTKNWDTSSCFDATTNYRFTPNVAGYYMVNGRVGLTAATSYSTIDIYKNGGGWQRGSEINASHYGAHINSIVYLNGSTDYIELYFYQNSGASKTVDSQNEITYFNGFLMRAA